MQHPVTICSIFPVEQKRSFEWREGEEGGFHTTFILKPCIDHRQPRLLAVGKKGLYYQLKPGIDSEQDAVPVGTHRQVADDLVREWTSGLIIAGSNMGPGICVCRDGDVITEGTYKGLTQPTEQELERIYNRQHAYFKALHDWATEQWQKGNRRDIPLNLVRMAAKWMGIQKANYMADIATDMAVSPCPICTRQTPTASAVCHHCGMVIRAIPEDIARLNAPRLGGAVPVPQAAAEPELIPAG